MSLSDHLKERLAKRPRKQIKWKREPEILLHPNVPKPLHGLAPRVILGEAWWNKERRKAYESTNFHCIACGIHKFDTKMGWLEGHEFYRINYRKGTVTYIRTVPLCTECHQYIHSGRLQMLVESGQMTKKEYEEIIKRGVKVLEEAGIEIAPPYDGPVADWKEWVLIVNGKSYPAPHQSEEDWKKFHNLTQGKDI
jgi:hypothetical protein